MLMLKQNFQIFIVVNCIILFRYYLKLITLARIQLKIKTGFSFMLVSVRSRWAKT